MMKIRKNLRNSIYEIYIICLYIPIYIRLFLYCLKHKNSPTILWKVNPTFPYGWLVCKKTTIWEKFQVNKQSFEKFFCKTLTICAKNTYLQKVKKIQIYIKKEKIQYPLILKPDDGVGWIGLWFIENEKSLLTALKTIKKEYILQEYIARPLELSVFFIKYPWQKGKIRSLTRRYTIKKSDDPELMIPTRRIIYKDESHFITTILEDRFNSISDIDGFYFGRFDIRVKDMNTFISKWAWFKIIEVNVGAHSMALQAFDNKYGWVQRYKIFFNQLKFAFDIAKKNEHTPAYGKQNVREFIQSFMKIFQNIDNQ